MTAGDPSGGGKPVVRPPTAGTCSPCTIVTSWPRRSPEAKPKIAYVGATSTPTPTSKGARSAPTTTPDGQTLQSYLATCDSAVWGRGTVPIGPVEDPRKSFPEVQAAQKEIKIGSNTTVIGDTGAIVDLDGVSNVIIRGLGVSHAHDCFPPRI